MSHFTVVVCIDDPGQLESVMARFDENREVAPYREYEEGEPAGHWLYRSLKRAAEDYANGTGIKPYKPDELGWSSASSKKTPDAQREEIRQDAEWFASLPDPITWADMAKLYNERYPDEDSETLFVAEDGRAYTMSERNPDAKWDWWAIGGRWNGYFPYRAEFARDVIHGEPGLGSGKSAPLHCDGGLKRALDLAALRDEKAAEARKTYAEFHALIAGTPKAKSWASFRADLEAKRLTIEEARVLYREQPAIRALEGTDFRWHDDPLDEFGLPESLYVEREKARAVPGFATLTTDGRWMAPGRMGWFGASTDSEDSRIGYWEAANAYIDSLPDDAYLIAVDCHI